MSTTLPGLPPWPAGKPLPAGGITILYDPGTGKEYRIDLTRLGGGAGNLYHTGTYTAHADGAQAITNAELPSLDTAALVVSVGVQGVDEEGNPRLKPLPHTSYALAGGVLTVLAEANIAAEDVLEIDWLTPGQLAAAGVSAAQLASLLVAGEGVTITPTQNGKLLVTATTVTAVPKAPAAPTGGQVDDTADTFSFLPNPAFPSAAQYKVVGRPGVTGAEQLDGTNSYVSGTRIYVKVVGAVARLGLAVYVAGSGSVPDGQALTNAEAFTGVVVAPGDTLAPAISFTVPASGATLTAGAQLLLTTTATDNVGVVNVSFTNGATGAVLGTGAKNGNTYTLAYTPTTAGPLSLVATASDAAGNSQTATVNVNVQATANALPVADAGSDATIQLPTSSIALMGTASDADQGDTLTYVWRQITGPNSATGLPAASLNVVASGLVAGAYQFGFQATDQKGGKSPEDYVMVTVNAASGQTEFVITNGDMSRNLRNDGTTRRSALCGLLFSSDATSATVEYENTQAVSAADQFGISLEIGGVSSLFKLAKGVGTFTDTFAIAGGGGAVQLLEFIEGVQEASSGDQAPYGYTTIKKVTFNAGSTSSKTKSAVGNDVAVALTDSKGVGVYASNPAQTSWVPKLRRLRPSLALYSDGHGNAKISVQLATDATQNALLDLYAPVWSGQNVPRLIVALGENDKNQGGDPTTELARVAALADKFHARYPGGLFYYELLYANATGNVAAWRTAGTNSKGSRGDWYRFIDPGSPELADPYHPTDSGYTTVAQAYHAGLDAVPATLAAPISLDAADSRNTSSTWYDAGTTGNNAALVGSPQLVDGAVFGRRAYFFPDDNVLRYGTIPAQASQASAYYLVEVFRSISSKTSQFLSDNAQGRTVTSAHGFAENLNGGQGCVYSATADAQPNGAFGPTLAVNIDTVLVTRFEDAKTVVYVGTANGTTKYDNLPVAVNRLNSSTRLAASKDATTAGVGSFYGYFQYRRIVPGTITDANTVSLIQAFTAGSSTPQPVSGVLTFEATGLNPLTNDQYTTTGTSGNYDVLAVSPIVFPAGQECAVGLTMADGDGDVVLGFSTSSTAPTGPGDVQYGFLFSAADKQLLIAKSGNYAGLAALAAGDRARVRRAADGALYLERSANGTTWTQVSNYSSSTAAGRLYAFFVAKSAPTTRATAPRYLSTR